MVIWIMGMSGSGKSTLGRAVVDAWRTRGSRVVHVDGDEIRRLLALDAGDAPYTIDGRRLVAERITALCEWLDGQGVDVVCSTMSIFPDLRAGNRTRFSHYLEVYLRAPMEALIRRDSKGLYGSALRGERAYVVGVDIPFPEPESPDLLFDTGGDAFDLEARVQEVLGHLPVT
ncbi:adenylyl-sulfate kinase [Gemmatimonas aurantiaca]|uniref:adenylyl-sulfate kinase n=1 Tax=Gemmatimonas aurantiaca TaxID=173480 RepID=UPI00301C7854